MSNITISEEKLREIILSELKENFSPIAKRYGSGKVTDPHRDGCYSIIDKLKEASQVDADSEFLKCPKCTHKMDITLTGFSCPSCGKFVKANDVEKVWAMPLKKGEF